jgi:tetratricopeptide (TPR) repeat protein
MSGPSSRPPEVPPEITFVSLPLGLAQFHHLPRHVPVWIHRQEAVEKSGYDFTEGARVMGELLEQAPGIPGAYLYQLFVRKWPLLRSVTPLLASGRVAEAIPKLVEVLEVDPECPLTCFQLGFCFRATGELQRSESFYRQALRMAPDAGWIHSNLARTLQAQGARAKAAEAYWKALELLPNDTFVLEQLTVLGELFLLPKAGASGQAAYVRRADYERKAGEILRDEKDPQALARLGKKLLEDGLVELAGRAFEKALATPGAPSEAVLGLGRTLLARGRAQEAERVLLGFLEREPSSAPGRLALYEAYEAQGEMDLAWEELQAAARSAPGDKGILRVLHGLFREADRLEEGVDRFKALAEDHPDQAAPWFFLAQGLSELERWEEARDAFEAAVKAGPKDEEVLLLYTAELGKRGEAKAVTELLGASRDDLPLSLTINLALAQVQSGKPKEGRATLEAFLGRKGVDPSDRKRVQDLLGTLGGEG